MAVIMLLAVIGATIAVIVSANSDDSSTPVGSGDTEEVTDDPSDSQITSRAEACRIEVASLADLNVNSDVTAVLSVIGQESRLLDPVQNVVTAFLTNMNDHGKAEASSRVSADSTTECEKAGNPILTEGQVQDLSSRLSPSDDSDALDQIAVFD